MRMILWAVGPQLIGIIMVLIGFIQKQFPPKKINNWYGYRTGTSMKNQQTWDKAQRYSAILMIKAGLIVTVIGVAVSALLYFAPIGMNIKAAVMVVSCLACSMGTVIVLLTSTEKHLEKTFGTKKL